MFKNYFDIKESQFTGFDTDTMGFRIEQEEEEATPSLDFVKDLDNGFELSIAETIDRVTNVPIYYVIATGPNHRKYVNNKMFQEYMEALEHLNSIPSRTDIANDLNWKLSKISHKKAKMIKKS